jgi:ribose transport system substrate-binding protein
MQRRHLLAIAPLLAACTNQPQKPIVGMAPKGSNHIFWKTVHAGAIKAGQEFGFDVEWNAPALEVDAARQIDIIQSMLTRRLAGIALAPVDSIALVPVVEQATRQGIPTVIFDSGLNTNQRLAYVATNNEEGGRMAAQSIGKATGGKGKVAIITFMPGSASTMERTKGFTDEIRQKFPAMDIVAVQFGMADRAKSMAVTENILTTHPDLAGLFADNESSASGAVQGVKARNAKQVKMVAFDASQQLMDELRAGWIHALIVQDPFRMGYESAAAIGRKLRGEATANRVDLPPVLISAADLDSPRYRELLYPDIQKYLGKAPVGH